MIRDVQVTDAARICEIYGPFCESTHVSFETCAPSTDEMVHRIQKTTARYPWLVWEEEGEVCGYAYASQHRERQGYRWSVDVAAYLDRAYRGRGIGRALYEALFERLRGLGFYSAYAGIALPNDASVGLHEAVGFRRVGVYHGVGYKHGSWRDVAWYELELRPKDRAPERLEF